MEGESAESYARDDGTSSARHSSGATSSLEKRKPALRANWGARSAGLEEESGKPSKKINAC